jgi:hypothetical protein
MRASGFDPASLREIPVWMVRDMAPGWQDHGASAYHGAEAIERLETALAYACDALRTVGNDYPGSSCCDWCHAKADEAAALAAGTQSAETNEDLAQSEGCQSGDATSSATPKPRQSEGA